MQGPGDLLQTALTVTQSLSPDEIASIFDEPVIIVSVPRAGSSVLFEQMRRLSGVWSIGGESHGIFNAFPHLRAENAALDSGSLGPSHADEQTCDHIRRCFLLLLCNHHGHMYLRLPPDQRPARVTLLEKTPRNALNIPFLLRVFPRARFVFLQREPQQNIASIIEAWTVGLQTGRFVTFRQLPGWDREGWCFLLPTGWRAMRGKSIAEIAAFQWSATNSVIADELGKLDNDRWTTVSYEQLISEPSKALVALAHFAGTDMTGVDVASGSLPLSRTTLTPPAPDKWRKHQSAIENSADQWQAVADRLKRL